MFRQMGLGALKRFLEEKNEGGDIPGFFLLYSSLPNRGRKSFMPCVSTLQSMGSGCMHGFWKRVLQSIGNVCHRQGHRQCWTALCVLFLDLGLVFPSNIGVLGKKEKKECQGDGFTCLTLFHRHAKSAPHETSQDRHDPETHRWRKPPFLLWTYWDRIPWACLPLREHMARTRHSHTPSYLTFNSVTVTSYATGTTHPPSLE